ncbi:MAG: hypothetical protein IKK65_03760 [Clostridia bacterium]|nr:hypothetical protein [Clostridia bacterium]
MQRLIEEFNSLKIKGMPTLTKLYGHKGDFVNHECKLPNGQIAKILDDSKMYYIAELPKENSERCFGLVTDKKQLAVFEYSAGGKDSELVIWKRI